ncbi:MAG: M28 family peptidase [Planctomycetes bacterium]|nr:M28 family peptidase [Planctomycetota bacterium]
MPIPRTALPLAVLALTATMLDAQELPDLTEAESSALETITKGKILTTISFLASDELQGRATPSRELQIAGAYVAARFRGAGLEGLGEDGSYYLHGVEKTLPKDAEVIVRDSLDGAPKPYEGVRMLAAAPKRIEMTYDARSANAGGKPDDYPADTEGVFIVDEPEAVQRGRRQSPMARYFGLVMQAQAAKAASAKLLLVRAPEESDLRKEFSDRQTMTLAQIGVPVLLVPASFTEGRYFFDVPGWVVKQSENRNVAGLLRGSDPKLRDEAIVVTAHLDHIGVGVRRGGGSQDEAADTINNGADDDATGCTAVLALADAFAALPQRPKRSLLFMTFYGEERGLVGSREFCANPAWPLDKIVANVNIEMIGRPEEGARNKMWMTGWTKSDLGDLMAEGSKRVDVVCFRHNRFSPMLYRQSDNWSFVEKGVVAHSFSAGSLHSDYHQPSDEWTKLDLDHMVTITKGLFAGILPIASGDATPKAK